MPRRLALVVFALFAAAPASADVLTISWLDGAHLFIDPQAASGYAGAIGLFNNTVDHTPGVIFETGPATRFEFVEATGQSYYEYGPGLIRLNDWVLPLLSLSVVVFEATPDNHPDFFPYGDITVEIGAAPMDAATRAALGLGRRAKALGGGGTFYLDAFDRDPFTFPRTGQLYNGGVIDIQVVPEPTILGLLTLGAVGVVRRRRTR